MPEFKLTDLVQRVDQDKLVIPDFQRGFKWQTPDIRKLLESLLLDFPIGAALLWRTQRAMLEFRRIEDVEFPDGDEGEPTPPQKPTSKSPLQRKSISFSTDSKGSPRSTSYFQEQLPQTNTSSSPAFAASASS
jgi:hypothetical protein